MKEDSNSKMQPIAAALLLLSFTSAIKAEPIMPNFVETGECEVSINIIIIA